MTGYSIANQDIANVECAAREIARFLIDVRTSEGFDASLFRALLGRDGAAKFDHYLTRSGRSAEDVLAEISLDAHRIQDLAAVIAPSANRQGLGEKGSLAQLQSGLSATFFQSPVIQASGKNAFKACPDIAKSVNFTGIAGSVAYVIAHKCSNNAGGSQTSAHDELERMALASTFPEGRYDGFVLRSPERVLSRMSAHFHKDSGVLALLQDGRGREADIARVQKICARQNHLSKLYVVCDTTENFILMQPLIHAAVVGLDLLTAGQRVVYQEAVSAFTRKFPQGHNGFYFS